MHVIRRGAALLVVHLSCLDGIRRREPRSVTKPYTGLGAESADTPATGITQCTKRFPVEEISWPSRQSGFDARRRFRHDHVEQFEVRIRRFKSRGFRWSKEQACSLFGVMNLIIETNDALGGGRYNIHEVVIVARLDIQLPAGKNRSLKDGQIL